VVVDQWAGCGLLGFNFGTVCCGLWNETAVCVSSDGSWRKGVCCDTL
jgi:hypothetical protein